ncbi:hypothetical protein [Vulcaniibacterium gelatinicum]|uniref:hypothetical protein n=1 Tax=Vulcaniibacterium gelatinicum TaxID=2598725 RepID=UPI0011C9B4D4|nr:hypothetical protein [Vulcaniibacterium gelatinicum]
MTGIAEPQKTLKNNGFLQSASPRRTAPGHVVNNNCVAAVKRRCAARARLRMPPLPAFGADGHGTAVMATRTERKPRLSAKSAHVSFVL